MVWKPPHGDLGPVLQARPAHLKLADIPLRLERKAAVVIGQVNRGEVGVAMVDRGVVEVQKDGRGVGGAAIVFRSLHRGPKRQRGFVPHDLADRARGADVQVAQGRVLFGVEERSQVKIADGLLVRIVVGYAGEVAVEPAECPVEPSVKGLPPGHQAGLGERPKFRGNSAARAR